MRDALFHYFGKHQKDSPLYLNMQSPDKRILYFTSFFYGQGGASLSLVKLLETFNNGRFESFAILPEQAKSQIERVVNTGSLQRRIIYVPMERVTRQLRCPWRLGRFLANSVRVILELRRLIRELDIDVVHANDMRDFHAPIAAWSCGVPAVWHLRACRPNFLVRYTFGWLMHAFAWRIVAVSQNTADRMVLRRSRKQGKVAVIHNPGPYRQRFHPGVDGSSVRCTYSLPAAAPVITMIGKLSPRKGHEVFVRSIPIIQERFPQAKFLIVGGELAGLEAYAVRLRDKSGEFVRAGTLIFTGECHNIPEIIAASDVIVHCSRFHDPFPGVVLEGMAVGKVVVAGNAGGVPEQIIDGEDGLLFKMGDAKDLAAKVIQVLSDEDKRRALGSAAVRNLDRKFNFSKFRNELAQLYGSLA